MKTILKIIVLCIAFTTTVAKAQDIQKWYADDIYYSASEKSINYLEVVTYIEEDETEYVDDLEDDYQVDMSYSMRISRFHRDYYGSSVNFNYGYFHDPYGFEYGFGCMPSYQPYYNNNWYNGYYSYNNWYNPWDSPWYNNQYAWNNPYGYNYGYGSYGYGYSPYYYDSPYAYTSSTTYGHRTSLGNNITPITNSGGQVIGGRKEATTTDRGTSTTINRNDYTTDLKTKEYKPQQSKNSYDYKTKRKTNSSTRVKTETKTTKTVTKPSYKRQSTNKKSTYTPSRNSSINRTSNTNRSSSTPSRRPR